MAELEESTAFLLGSSQPEDLDDFVSETKPIDYQSTVFIEKENAIANQDIDSDSKFWFFSSYYYTNLFL